MARYWVLAIILALFMRGCLSGQVRNGDVSVDYANAGSMTRLSFAFLLETKL